MSDLKIGRDAIVVFAKSAAPGRVKTRLTPPLSAEQAAQFYRAFVADVTGVVNAVARRRKEPLSKVLAFAGALDDPICLEVKQQGYQVVDQGDGGLGERMKGICRYLADAGAERIVIIGTDSPTLHEEHLELAFDLLDNNDVVWGPSFDGGYYLIGLEVAHDKARPHEFVFEDIEWSTSRVLAQSWERATSASLLCDLLGFWYDIDTIADLEMLEFHLLEYLAKRKPELAKNTAALLKKRAFTTGNVDGNST